MKPELYLLAEHRFFLQSIWKNEDVGERRVRFFVTLVTAVVTALVALRTRDGGADVALPHLAKGALAILLLFGVLTFLRIIHRDRVTDEYREIADYLRTRLTAMDAALDDIRLPFRPRQLRLLQGGLVTTVGAMNSAIAGLLLASYWPAHYVVAVSLGAGSCAIAHWAVFALIRTIDPGRTERETPERFRMGVGAVIRRRDGRVLALERRDVAGAWQLVQGGVHAGEDLQDAVFREIHEETGIERSAFQTVREVPVMLGYELPREMRSKKTGRGQVHKWYLLDLANDDVAIRLGDDGEFAAFQWTTMATLLRIAVAFRQPAYRELARWNSKLPVA